MSISNIPTRVGTGLFLVVAGLFAGTAPANAAAPSNDDVAAATVISGLPFTDTVDTTEATNNAVTDGDCTTVATVWYRFTPTSDSTVEFNTVGSDYDTTLQLFSGTPPSLEPLACNDDYYDYQSRIVWQVEAGTTYYIQAGTCCDIPPDGQVGPGGNLVFNALVAPDPVNEVAVDVDPVATVTRTGLVTLTGTVTCDQPGFVTMDNVVMRQVWAGRHRAEGYNALYDLECGPEPTTWTLQFGSATGTIFGAGKATVETGFYAYNSSGGTDYITTEHAIRLKRTKG